MDEPSRLLLQVNKYVEREERHTYGAVMALDILWLVELRQDVFSEDLSKLDAHLIFTIY